MKTSKNIGRPPRIPDGTEGYATISLHMVKPHPMIETIGYFVKGDSDLKSYLKDSQPCYEPEKPEDPNFVYFYLSEPDLSKTLLNVRIEAHRFYKKQKTISCCIVIKKDEAAINPVCNKKPHIFLPASPKELKKSDLWNYSKRVTSNKNLSEGNYKGVQIHVGEKVCKILKSVKFSISNNKSNNTFYINSDNDGDVFEKLRDDGPLLCDEGDGHWTVVGWYKKDSPQNRITVHHLRAQGPLYIWKDKQSCPSASDQPDGLAGNGNDHDQHSDSSGQSGSSSVRVDHSAGNGSQHESSSGYMSNNYQGQRRSKTNKEALNEEVMDEIAIKLDQPLSRIRQNWKDAGKRLKIDPDDLDQIERGESNPAKELLEHANISVDPTLTTSGKFREIIMGFENRTDLHNLIEEVGITQDSDLNRPLKEVIRPDSPNMKKMAAYLNRSPSGLSNWKQLAFAWGLGSDQFKPQPPQSPTKSLLDWMCTEDHVTTVDQFLNILGVKTKRYHVKEEIN